MLWYDYENIAIAVYVLSRKAASFARKKTIQHTKYVLNAVGITQKQDL